MGAQLFVGRERKDVLFVVINQEETNSSQTENRCAHKISAQMKQTLSI